MKIELTNSTEIGRRAFANGRWADEAISARAEAMRRGKARETIFDLDGQNRFRNRRLRETRGLRVRVATSDATRKPREAIALNNARSPF